MIQPVFQVILKVTILPAHHAYWKLGGHGWLSVYLPSPNAATAAQRAIAFAPLLHLERTGALPELKNLTALLAQPPPPDAVECHFAILTRERLRKVHDEALECGAVLRLTAMTIEQEISFEGMVIPVP